MRRDTAVASFNSHEFLARVRASPWKFGFTVLLRRLGSLHRDLPRIGLATRPQQEAFRLGQCAALTFAPREIAEVVLPAAFDLPAFAQAVLVPSPPLSPPPPPPPPPPSTTMPAPSAGPANRRHGNSPAHPVIRVYGLGLLGPNGPLPLHYTELVRDRTENHNDTTLADFLDVFHHRYLAHMYRAWAQSQSAAGLDRDFDETFSRYVARLTGHDPVEIRDSVLPDHARLAASTHLVREARNPDGLAQTIARFFDVPVHLQEFVMHWIRLDDEDQTHLGRARSSSVLGLGAIAGEVVADRQSKFRIVLGPLPIDQYLRFTPQGKDLPLLVEWVRAFVGYEFLWEVELRVRKNSAPPARLDDSERLGWSTWLGGSKADEGRAGGAADWEHTVGMVFEAERYAGGFATARAASV